MQAQHPEPTGKDESRARGSCGTTPALNNAIGAIALTAAAVIGYAVYAYFLR